MTILELGNALVYVGSLLAAIVSITAAFRWLVLRPIKKLVAEEIGARLDKLQHEWRRTTEMLMSHLEEHQKISHRGKRGR